MPSPKTDSRRTFFIIMERLKERQELVLIPPQNRLNLRGFLRVRDKHLGEIISNTFHHNDELTIP